MEWRPEEITKKKRNSLECFKKESDCRKIPVLAFDWFIGSATSNLEFPKKVIVVSLYCCYMDHVLQPVDPIPINVHHSVHQEQYSVGERGRKISKKTTMQPIAATTGKEKKILHFGLVLIKVFHFPLDHEYPAVGTRAFFCFILCSRLSSSKLNAVFPKQIQHEAHRQYLRGPVKEVVARR